MPTHEDTDARPPMAQLVRTGEIRGGVPVYRQHSAVQNMEVPDVPLFRLADETRRRVIGGMIRGRGETFALTYVGPHDRTLLEPMNDAARALLEQSDDRPRRLASDWP